MTTTTHQADPVYDRAAYTRLPDREKSGRVGEFISVQVVELGSRVVNHIENLSHKAQS